MSKFCPKCGHSMSDDALFCSGCGAHYPSSQNDQQHPESRVRFSNPSDLPADPLPSNAGYGRHAAVSDNYAEYHAQNQPQYSGNPGYQNPGYTQQAKHSASMNAGAPYESAPQGGYASQQPYPSQNGNPAYAQNQMRPAEAVGIAASAVAQAASVSAQALFGAETRQAVAGKIRDLNAKGSAAAKAVNTQSSQKVKIIAGLAGSVTSLLYLMPVYTVAGFSSATLLNLPDVANGMMLGGSGASGGGLIKILCIAAILGTLISGLLPFIFSRQNKRIPAWCLPANGALLLLLAALIPIVGDRFSDIKGVYGMVISPPVAMTGTSLLLMLVSVILAVFSLVACFTGRNKSSASR